MKKPPKKAGGSANAAHQKLTSAQRLLTTAQKINDTFGPPELCTWRYEPGVCRFQTTSPELGRKLNRRAGARLVGWSVNGRYLRIFQEEIELWRAKNLVKRYLKVTNAAFSVHASRLEASKSGGDQ